MTRLTRSILLLPVVLVFSIRAFAGIQESNKIARIHKTIQPPRIDGNPADEVWGNIPPLTGFVQYDPYNGRPASENTVVKLAFDEHYFYALFVCYDTRPETIAANLTPREGYYQDDEISLTLDTYNDQRTSYKFSMNPKGVQKDEPGDYVWESGAQVTPTGWIGEMRIPFKSIRFPDEKQPVWRINFSRYIFRLKETDYYTDVGRDDIFLEKSAALQGLADIVGGKNLEFYPYAGLRHSESHTISENRIAGGLDLKYALTSSLNLDLTASPDYSEIESDPFFYNLTPYEYRLREQRPFFQEASRYLEGGFDGMFYSKRIRDPKIAAKVTGKQGHYTVGLIGALNAEDNQDSFIGAVRLQRDVLKYSSVAAMVSGYDHGDFQNLNTGFHTNLRFSQKLSFSTTIQISHNADLERNDRMYSNLYLRYTPDVGFRGTAFFTRTENNYEPRAGFWRARDIQVMGIQPGYYLRLNEWGIRRLELSGSFRKQETPSGLPLGYSITPFDIIGTTLKNAGAGINYQFGREKIQLASADGLTWHDQFFTRNRLHLFVGYFGSRFWDFDTGFMLSRKPVYGSDYLSAFDGKEISSVLVLGINPVSRLHLYFKFDHTMQQVRETGERVFQGSLTQLSVAYQMTRKFHTSVLLAYDSHEDHLKLETVVGYEFGMGSKVVLSYKSRGTTSMRQPFLYPDDEMTVSLKASYLFRV